MDNTMMAALFFCIYFSNIYPFFTLKNTNLAQFVNCAKSA